MRLIKSWDLFYSLVKCTYNQLKHKMIIRIFRLLFVFTFLLFICSCLYTPKVSEYQAHHCSLVTKRLELKENTFKPDPKLVPNAKDGIDVLIGLAVIGPTTLIVSGSVVMVGNTIHWIEAYGRCDNTKVYKVSSKILKSSEYYKKKPYKKKINYDVKIDNYKLVPSN